MISGDHHNAITMRVDNSGWAYTSGMRLTFWFLVLAGACWPQGTTPKANPGDYRAKASGAMADYGIEYQVRTVSTGRTSFLTDDYLVIEVAVYPRPDQKARVDPRNFTLSLNGKGRDLLAQTPGIVAASFKYPDWESRPELTATAGVGDRGIILGRRPMTERFPGDPRPRQRRLPQVPAEGAGQPAGALEEDAPDPGAVVQNLSLPEGETDRPVAGYIFFPYRGRLGAIKEVNLRISEPGGGDVLPVRLR